jgi:hypothetical protein
MYCWIYVLYLGVCLWKHMHLKRSWSTCLWRYWHCTGPRIHTKWRRDKAAENYPQRKHLGDISGIVFRPVMVTSKPLITTRDRLLLLTCSGKMQLVELCSGQPGLCPGAWKKIVPYLCFGLGLWCQTVHCIIASQHSPPLDHDQVLDY